MRITVRRSGGEAGVSEQLGPVDTESLATVIGDEIVGKVEEVGFFDLAEEFQSGGAFDLLKYTVSVVDGERRHTVTWWEDSTRLPPELTELLSLLERSGQVWRDVPIEVLSPLFQRWVHSREEDEEGLEVYRPAGFAFPPSRGREGFDISETGEFVRHDIGPGDGTVAVGGRWAARRLEVDTDDGRSSQLDIVSYDDSVLRVRVRGDGVEAGPSGAPEEVLASRSISGGFAGVSNTLTVFQDGRLTFSDRRAGEEEAGTVPAEELEPLRDLLASKAWRAVGPFFGQPVSDGFQTIVVGGGKRTGFARPSAKPVQLPQVLREVLIVLEQLRPSVQSAVDPAAEDSEP